MIYRQGIIKKKQIFFVKHLKKIFQSHSIDENCRWKYNFDYDKNELKIELYITQIQKQD